MRVMRGSIEIGGEGAWQMGCEDDRRDGSGHGPFANGDRLAGCLAGGQVINVHMNMFLLSFPGFSIIVQVARGRGA